MSLNIFWVFCEYQISQSYILKVWRIKYEGFQKEFFYSVLVSVQFGEKDNDDIVDMIKLFISLGCFMRIFFLSVDRILCLFYIVFFDFYQKIFDIYCFLF